MLITKMKTMAKSWAQAKNIINFIASLAMPTAVCWIYASSMPRVYNIIFIVEVFV